MNQIDSGLLTLSGMFLLFLLLALFWPSNKPIAYISSQQQSPKIRQKTTVEKEEVPGYVVGLNRYDRYVWKRVGFVSSVSTKDDRVFPLFERESKTSKYKYEYFIKDKDDVEIEINDGDPIEQLQSGDTITIAEKENANGSTFKVRRYKKENYYNPVV